MVMNKDANIQEVAAFVKRGNFGSYGENSGNNNSYNGFF